LCLNILALEGTTVTSGCDDPGRIVGASRYIILSYLTENASLFIVINTSTPNPVKAAGPFAVPVVLPNH
jgi:hypothetical protein